MYILKKKFMIQSAAFDLAWQKEDINTVLPVSIAVITFIIYWFTTKSEKIKSYFFEKFNYDDASAYHITFLRVFGFLTMGLGSGIVCLTFIPDFSLSDYGLSYNRETALFTSLWSFGLMIIIIPLAFIGARKPANLINYPQIRARLWTRKITVLNIVSWIVYLFGYEFLFRGILLFPLASELGAWPAVAINIAFYSIIHIPKGLNETAGAIILGLILCILTLISGTIWIAFFTHVALALTNSFTAMKYHPDMHFVK
jgi:membrane protease YdiL (CAAX protease family)